MEQYTWEEGRTVHKEFMACDLCIVGGGLAGTCAAITAARGGLSVTLIQDRPVLGGNSSSEVRLWALGATAHNHNNNRWAREGGVIDEILVENMHRNREGNALVYDTILLEKVIQEPGIHLLLNTVATQVKTSYSGTGDAVRFAVDEIHAYSSSSETAYIVKPQFVMDASGDGFVAHLVGLPFRFGAEPVEEFGEGFAPDAEQYGELLGHSLFFMTKDTGQPVRFVAPSYALRNANERIPRFRSFDVNDQGCEFWWIEYGGRLDTIHDTEKIKWELWRIVLGVWDYIKNSGEYPEAENLTLEWVGHIPGKRESRRFEGQTMLTQQDLVSQRTHEDAVSVGGWSVDLHPADGVYSAQAGADQYHIKGPYQIPYSVMVPKRSGNLFLAGRIVSTSHVAFGSTRVMLTGAHNAQAAAIAAVLCKERGLLPTDVAQSSHIGELQRRLVRTGQFIPGYVLKEPDDIAASATVSATTTLDLATGISPERARDAWVARGEQVDNLLEHVRDTNTTAVSESVPSHGVYQRSILPEFVSRFPDIPVLEPLTRHVALMIPAETGRFGEISVHADVIDDTTLTAELRVSEKPTNHTPEVILETKVVPVSRGSDQRIRVDFEAEVSERGYAYVVFRANEHVALRTMPQWITGMFILEQTGEQFPPAEWGLDSFEIWTPPRRPGGLPVAFLRPNASHGYLAPFAPENVINGLQRPGIWPNAWVADPFDPNPELTLEWSTRQSINRVEIVFDTDYNHPMETVVRGHPEAEMPTCVRAFQLMDDNGHVVAEESSWYQSLWAIELPETIRTTRLSLRVTAMNGDAPAAVLAVRVYA